MQIYVKGSPSKYIVLDDVEVVAHSNEPVETTGVFEYETCYTDDKGNTRLWMDTEEIYCGNEPPEDTENSRWVIMGCEDGKYDERRFKKQVKQ